MKDNVMRLVQTYRSYNQENDKAKQQFIDFLKREKVVFGKLNPKGHVTASVWIVDDLLTQTLLTHHKKLNKWIQLGGHTEIGETIWESAIREAEEESGLNGLRLKDESAFDLDVHWIPEHKGTPGHWHYDLRFLILVPGLPQYVISDESHDIAWIDLERVGNYTQECSVIRMVEKTLKMR